MTNQDDLMFAPEVASDESSRCADSDASPWKVLIVDDEDQVHAVTTLVLGDFHFDGRPVAFYHAYSGAEGQSLFHRHADFALAIIDVVMESDNAGLKLVHYVRRSLKNALTRLVLRTGQPGEAPEESIIFEYDLNDYKDKSELTATRLKTLLLTALRSYRDMVSLARNRRALETLLRVSGDLFSVQDLPRFTHIILDHLLDLLVAGNTLPKPTKVSGLAAVETGSGTRVLATLGKFSGLEPGVNIELPGKIGTLLAGSDKDRKFHFGDAKLGFVTPTRFGQRHLFYLEEMPAVRADTRQLLALYRQNVCTAMEKAHALKNLQEAQEQLVHTLSQTIEIHSSEHACAGSCLAALCELLARESGFNVEDAHCVGLAARMHDIGMVCLPEKLVHKVGPLSEKEQLEQQQHVAHGLQLIENTDQQILRYARKIIQTHHENWDGSGYPDGLAGEEIDILGRIVAVADAFDARLSQGSEATRLALDEACNDIVQGSGTRFDPALVKIFQNCIDDIRAMAVPA